MVSESLAPLPTVGAPQTFREDSAQGKPFTVAQIPAKSQEMRLRVATTLRSMGLLLHAD